jgi:hypothetical protein
VEEWGEIEDDPLLEKVRNLFKPPAQQPFEAD